MKNLMLVVAVAGLAACSAPLAITSNAVDVTFANSIATKGIVAYDPIKIRAYGNVDGERVELANVPCSLQGSGFTAQVFTPAIVNMPDYGPRSRPVTVRCTYEGRQQIIQALPYNVTQAQRGDEGSYIGLSNNGISARIRIDLDNTPDDWSYRPIFVRF